MSELNFQLLEENIRMLLVKNNITQQKLAEIAGMTQANVSKALNRNEKKRFTLDQVYRIAQYFEVSIDSLVGNPAENSAGTSPRDAFRFITKFLSAGKLRTAELIKLCEYSFYLISLLSPSPLPLSRLPLTAGSTVSTSHFSILRVFELKLTPIL